MHLPFIRVLARMRLCLRRRGRRSFDQMQARQENPNKRRCGDCSLLLWLANPMDVSKPKNDVALPRLG